MSTTAARVRVPSGRLSGLSKSRVTLAAFALLALLAFVVIYRKGVSTSFYYDEWDFVLRRHTGGLSTFIEPHNEHLSLVPVVIYKLLFATAGLDHYGAYRAVLLLLHLVIAGLVFAFTRPRVGDGLALGAAALLLFLGAGFEDILWPFQIGFLSSLATGLGALVLLERGTRRADIGACVLLALSLASASLGIPLVIGAVAYVVWRPSRWQRLWVVAVPIALYGLWYLGYGKSAFRSENIPAAPQFTAEEVAGAVSGIVGLGVEWGRALAVAAAGGLLLHLSRVRVLPRSFVMVLTAALAFWVLTALARAQIGEPANPRYLYPGGLLVLLIAAEALRGWRPSRRGLILVGVVVLFGVLSGLKGFKDGANGLRATEGVFQAELTPLEIGAGHMSPDFQPDQQRAPQVVTGLYLDAVRSIGSSPAYTESQLASLDEGRKQLADGVFVRGYGLALAPGAAVGAGAAPVADPTSEAVVQTRGSCVVGRSVNPAGGASVALMVPPDGISLRAPGASVSLRRFADDFGGVPPLQGDASDAALRIPRDRSARPWHVVLQNTQRFTACGLGA